MSLTKRVETLEKKVNSHEIRISKIENSFDFIKNQLSNIPHLINQLKLKRWQLITYVLIGLLVGLIIAAVGK